VGTNSTNKEGEAYIRHLHNAIKSHNIFTRIDSMYDKLDKFNKLEEVEKQEILRKLNIIDNIITELKLCAEKKHCAKTEPCLWSPTLYQSSLRFQYINVLKKSKRQRTDASKRLERIWNKMTEKSKEKIRNNTGTLKNN
jgi:hypothetical protein